MPISCLSPMCIPPARRRSRASRARRSSPASARTVTAMPARWPDPSSWRPCCARSPGPATWWSASVPDRLPIGRTACPPSWRGSTRGAGSRERGARSPRRRADPATPAGPRPAHRQCADRPVDLVPGRRPGRIAVPANRYRGPGRVPLGAPRRGPGHGDRRRLQPLGARRRHSRGHDPTRPRLRRDHPTE